MAEAKLPCALKRSSCRRTRVSQPSRYECEDEPRSRTDTWELREICLNHPTSRDSLFPLLPCGKNHPRRYSTRRSRITRSSSRSRPGNNPSATRTMNSHYSSSSEQSSRSTEQTCDSIGEGRTAIIAYGWALTIG